MPGVDRGMPSPSPGIQESFRERVELERRGEAGCERDTSRTGAGSAQGTKGKYRSLTSQIPHHCRQTEGPGHTALLLLLNSHNLKACQPPGKLQCGELKQKGPGVILQGELLMCLARS